MLMGICPNENLRVKDRDVNKRFADELENAPFHFTGTRMRLNAVVNENVLLVMVNGLRKPLRQLSKITFRGNSLVLLVQVFNVSLELLMVSRGDGEASVF